jgi:hypothetical protein
MTWQDPRTLAAGPGRDKEDDYQTDGRKSRLGTVIEGDGEEDGWR